MANGSSSIIHAERNQVRALPSNVTFRNLIRANKRKSGRLMVGMGLLVVLLGATAGGAITAYGGGGEVLIPAIAIGANFSSQR